MADYFKTSFTLRKYKKEEAVFLLPLRVSVQNLHDFAAAAGDYIAGFHVQGLAADGAVDVTFLFCPDHADQSAFEFHSEHLVSCKTAGPRSGVRR